MARPRAFLLAPALLVGMPQAAPAAVLHVAICGETGNAEIPIGPSDDRRHDDRCPMACHAVTCERSRHPRRA